MQTVDEQTETIHLYVVREEAPKPSLFPIFLSVLALVSLIALSVALPYEQPVTRLIIRVPAVLLPMKTFQATVPIIPTGVKVYVATSAHGTLTITNGSVIAQVIPAGFTIQNVATDRTVYVPAGSANGYGYASVPAHALMSGKQGNIPAYGINQVEGSSIYMRNLVAFRGGTDSYSIKVVTAQDKQPARIAARDTLTLKSSGLHYPCQETVTNRPVLASLIVTWRCQFVSYHVASYMHVTGVKLQGKNLILAVVFVEHPVHIWVK